MSNSINFLDDDIAKYECKPSRCERFCQLFYDPQKKTFLGRTGCSWCKIGIFYLIFYSSLATFFMSMMLVFIEGLVNDYVPSRTGQDSLLKLRPGISMRPLPNEEETLIKFASDEPQSYMPYLMDYKGFLEPYDRMLKKKSNKFADCNETTKVPDEIDSICRFNLTELGPCNFEEKFGFSTGKPCVLLKLNKIYGWIPDTLDNESPTVHCEGQNLLDKQNVGEMSFYPSNRNGSGYFNHNFYPYLAQVGYLPPLIAVQFRNLKKHIVIMVECSVRNVKYESNKVQFEFLID